MPENALKRMNPGGRYGRMLRDNEAAWIHRIFEDDPNLFGAFLDPEGNNLFKTMWHGEFPGKLLTGIAQTYRLTGDPETKRIGDRFAELFRQSQQEDGYLGPWSRTVRFSEDTFRHPEELGKWDTWGHYHCILGLYSWYLVTGNREALETARKALDCVYRYYIAENRSIASQKWAECNLAVGHAFALFYGETGDPRYREAAERIVEKDWNDFYPDYYTGKVLCAGWLKAAEEGKTFAESGQPRWEGIYSLETLPVLCETAGNTGYRDAAAFLWTTMVGSDRHNTGSFGTGEGATDNPYGDGTETCNTVAWTAFSTDYLKMTGDPAAADELELSLFNAVMGSLTDGNREFTYFNPSDGRREPARIPLWQQAFEGGKDLSCCQANGNRGLSMAAEWALLRDEETVFLNYYGPCEMEGNTAEGRPFRILQKTDYPASGRVELRVIADPEKPLKLALRIPGWSVPVKVTLNGENVPDAFPGEYLRISRSWTPEDLLTLEFSFAPRFWKAEPGRIGNKISVYRGPLLLAYCPEGKRVRFTRESLAEAVFRYNGETEECGEKAFRVGKETEIPVETEDGTVLLTDYVSAGRGGREYVTWLDLKEEEI